MNILFHGYEFPPWPSGVGAYMWNMSRALVAMGHKAVVVTGKQEGQPEQEEKQGVVIYRTFTWAESGSAKVAERVFKIAKRHDVDMIEGADHLGDCASLLRMQRSMPVLVKSHSCQIVHVLQEAQIYYPWQRMTLWAARLRRHAQMRREVDSIRNADALSAPSQRMLNELQRQFHNLPKLQAVIPNPAPWPLPHITEGEAKNPTVLFVGRIEFLKGIQYLPGIMESVWKKFPEMRLEIAGGDSYARGIGSLKRWLSKKMGPLNSRVSYLGVLNQAELSEAYQRAWVVLAPSRWDNFPTVILEAMAYGKPIVTTPHGGMPEMLDTSDCVVDFPEKDSFADALSGILEDPQKRGRVGKAVREQVERKYKPDIVVEAYIDFAEKVCASPLH